ncbi:MAG: hypothetical protein U0L42_05765 [Methanobrevibacter sp.]|uniref:hypothetical protein n=1 Tax=Methanobrevibacter sp. TaxID=66852 RepID=UPI002E759ADF|nr:hypothetical protein [Methanobrevibacter sp.]MEE0935161.1 hypothetical protein [Methanobrevibacter sp.]
MNVEEKILDLNRQHSGEDAEIKDLLLIVMTKFQLFEPCLYLSEDDEWVNVSMVSIEDESVTQPMSIKKEEISMVGIFNREEIELNLPKTDSEVFYQ